MEKFEDKPRVEQSVPEPLRPPLQPLEIKKSGLPPSLLIFLVVLGFGIAAAVFAFFSKNVAKKNISDAPKPLIGETETIVEVIAPKETVSDEKAAPPSTTPVPVLTLSGILFGHEGSFVLINGRIVPEGGKVEGAKVEKILKDRVELSFEGRTIILKSR